MKIPRLSRVLLVSCMSLVVGAAAARAQTPLTPLHTFTSTPNFLIQHPDGNFYGTSGSGGGSIFFRMTPDGTVTPLHTFTPTEAGTELILGADGNFYGATTGVHDPFAGRINANAFRLTTSAVCRSSARSPATIGFVCTAATGICMQRAGKKAAAPIA